MFLVNFWFFVYLPRQSVHNCHTIYRRMWRHVYSIVLTPIELVRNSLMLQNNSNFEFSMAGIPSVTPTYSNLISPNLQKRIETQIFNKI